MVETSKKETIAFGIGGNETLAIQTSKQSLEKIRRIQKTDEAIKLALEEIEEIANSGIGADLGLGRTTDKARIE